jgi:hypothetical protein
MGGLLSLLDVKLGSLIAQIRQDACEWLNLAIFA